MGILWHNEGGLCWCELVADRERALDHLYPDRCQIPTGPGTPNPPDLRLCVEPAGHQGPCRMVLERRGSPCHFCEATFEGENCPACWTDLTTMALADVKALFAACDDELSIDPGPA
jgi:hypothetical protein